MAHSPEAHHLDDHLETPIITRFAAWIRGEKQDIWVIVIYALGIGLFSLAVPIAVQSLVNTVAFGSLLQPIVVLTALVFGVLLLSGVMKGLQYYVAEYLQRRVFVRIALDLARRLPNVEYDIFRKRLGVDYVNRFLEVSVVQKMLAQLLLDGLTGLLQIVIGLTLLAFYHPILLAFSIVLVIVIFLIVFGFGRGAIRTSVEESNAKYQVLSWLETLAAVPLAFRSKEGGDYARLRADLAVQRYLREREAYFRIVFRQKIASLILKAVGSAVLLGLGGWLVINNQLTLGQLVAAELIVTMILESLARIMKQLESLYDIAAAFVKLDSLIELPVETTQGEFFGTPDGAMSVVVKNLLPRETPFRNQTEQMNLSIPAGARAAIYGKNGSGKSSLADVIYRLRVPRFGRVELDGLNVQDIHPEELRSEVTLIRGLEIFEGTIEDNLRIGSSIPMSEIRKALDLLGLDEELSAFPQGLRTYLPGTAGPLSKGQAIRLMIARALIHRPRILIIDETLDAIDDSNIDVVMRAVLDPSAPWTLIVLTHDLEFLRRFPERYVLEDGSLTRV